MSEQGTLMLDEPSEIASEPQPDATNPLMLLHLAVEKGMDPAQLKALVDLHEQWRAARANEAFSASMNACQAEMPTAVRDARNEHTKSTYIRLETINHVAKPIYTKHGFALSFAEADSSVTGFKRTICDVRHIAGHRERYHIDLPIDGTGAKGGASSMNAVQGCISTGSYGLRVLVCRIFNITVADTDLDGQAPPRENPPPNPDAPQTQPRGQRQPKPQAVTKEQCAELLAAWRAKNPEPSGDVPTWNRRWAAWVVKITGHDFKNAMNTAEWTEQDYTAVDAALT